MQAFKLNFKELFIIILVSLPIGGFLYFNNLNKIKYDYEIKKGIAITASLCENYSYDVKDLLIDYDFENISFYYKNGILNPDSSFTFKIINKSTNYKITFNGKVGQENLMLEKFNEIFLIIKNKETINFNKYFKSLNYNCNSKVLPAFKLINAEIVSEKIRLSSQYKDIHLYFLFMSPLILIYLLLISFKYIRK
jgi:hypothetical protein